MRARPVLALTAVSLLLAGATCAHGDDDPLKRWVDHFTPHAPLLETTGVAAGHIGELPSFSVKSDSAGPQLIRVSLPFPIGAFPAELGIKAIVNGKTILPDVRVLTFHPGRPQSIRRALITLPFEIPGPGKYEFALALTDPAPRPTIATEAIPTGGVKFKALNADVVLTPNDVTIDWGNGKRWTATLIAPPSTTPQRTVPYTVEFSDNYLWQWLLVPDPIWPRIIEVQLDSLGTVSIRADLQRLEKGDAYAPELGWKISGPALPETPPPGNTPTWSVRASNDTDIVFPRAQMEGRGSTTFQNDAAAGIITYHRCVPEDQVPFQETAWRDFGFVITPHGQTPRNFLFEPNVNSIVAATAYDSLYGNGTDPDLSLWPVLDDARAYMRSEIVHSALRGDDFGNVTSSSADGPPSVYGMNRLNHCPAIFEEAYRSGDRELRDTAVAWCENMAELSLWWGDTDDFGGARYNNATAAGQKDHAGDQKFMWRTNGTSNFCAKGLDSFFYAYEETGDPRMNTALDAQVGYARKYVHADQGECRNIGVALDFMQLYRFTHVPMYRDEALRLFRELRTKLSEGDLFSQGGMPIEKDPPYINDDDVGYKHPFAKPYIIGYALEGLPELMSDAPDEPKLRDVVRAVADFLAQSEDPCGGWRYPHPASTSPIISQGMEHAAQMMHAAKALESKGENIDHLLDAIETTLQARVGGYEKSGMVLAGLTGWEQTEGILKDGKTVYDLYKKPADRDPSKDYTEGAVSVGGAPPKGLVYFSDVLRFYVAHRPAERLLHANPQLTQILARIPNQRLKLTPQDKGAFLRVERPDNAQVGFTLWAPEWISYPTLGFTADELGGMHLDWQHDDATGAAWYTLDRPEAILTAQFTPHIDYVECAYTVWPKASDNLPLTLALNPSLQLKASVFEGEDKDLLSRTWYLSGGKWIQLSQHANDNSRNMLYLRDAVIPEPNGNLAFAGWKTIEDPRPELGILACTSADGSWVAATATESANCIANNADVSQRAIEAQSLGPMRTNGPTTARVNVYLMKGNLQSLENHYRRDLACWKTAPAPPVSAVSQTESFGLKDMLPTFNDARVRRMEFPLSFEKSGLPFAEWRNRARSAYIESLGPRPPKAPFAVKVIDTEDRGNYVAEKIALNISADERIKAYLLTPKGKGPFPGIVALHDHGAHFSIGKEKVIKPFNEPQERLSDAQDWISKSYGGRYIGDELAKRGYVVVAIDALFWGDRGRAEGVKYDEQEALAANMLQLGLSWAGMITWDDVRTAEFIQGLPDVDPARIGCVGLSMGSHRTWSLAAATDIVKAGAAICWMGDTQTLTAVGNNQTRGNSSFSMIHPWLRNMLDYPDVASVACPKPMLFYNGTKDGLFPTPGVEAAYRKMHGV